MSDKDTNDLLDDLPPQPDGHAFYSFTEERWLTTDEAAAEIGEALQSDELGYWRSIMEAARTALDHLHRSPDSQEGEDQP